MLMVDVVTGGVGFIGSHVVDKLMTLGRNIQVIDNNLYRVLSPDGYTTIPENFLPHFTSDTLQRLPRNLQISIGDIRDPSHWKEHIRQKDFKNADHVYHLAALADIVPSIEKPIDYFATNVTGTLHVLEAARHAGCKRFIYAASASCYGMLGGVTEEISPQYPYALTKYLGEQLVLHWGKVYGMSVVSLRLFNVYGLRQRTTGAYGAMFGTFLAQKANNAPMTIIGDGEQKRDFVHVSDVVEAMVLAANSDCQGIYNVGTGQPTSINRIAQLIGGDTVHIPKRPGEPNITYADIARTTQDLGWKPKITIEQGVAELVEHLQDYKDAPLWRPDTIEKATKTWFERLSS